MASPSTFLSVAVLLTACSLSNGYEMGNMYVYDYSSMVYNGHYDLQKLVAAAQVSGQLSIYATEPSVFTFQFSNMKAAKNGELDMSALKKLPGATDEYDPDIDIGGTAVTINDIDHLQAPFFVRYSNGLVKSVEVGADEPEWSVNLKKAVVSQMQLDMGRTRTDGPKLSSPYDSGPENNNVFKTYEDTVSGDCSTIVQTSALTEALAASSPLLQTSLARDLCGGKLKLEVTKTRDLGRCNNKLTNHFVIPALYLCNLDSQQCGTAIQGSETSRMLLCQDSTNFAVVHVGAYDELSVKPYGIDTQAISGGSDMVLKLTKVLPAPAPKPKTAPTKTLTSLAYVHPPEAKAATSGVSKLLSEVAAELKRAYDSSSDESGRMSMVSSMLSSLDGDELDQLWAESKDKAIVKDLFLDALVAAGSPATVRFIKNLVESKAVSGIKANWMVIAMGYYVRTPTQDLLKDLTAMLASEAVQSSPELKQIATLMMADLLSVSCDSPFLRSKRFATEALGNPPCTTQSQVVQDFLQRLKADLKSAATDFERFTLLTALGTLGIEAVIPELLPYIRGSDNHRDTGLRLRAIFSLHRVMFTSPNKVYPLLMALADNIEERAEVRMAAIALLLNANAPLSVWQKLAYRTWFEPNRQVGAFSRNILESLSQMPALTPLHKNLAEKAILALDISKTSKFGLPFSASDMRSSYLAEGLGVITHTPQWRVADEHYPVGIGHSLWYQLGPFTSNPLQIYIWNFNMEESWNSLVQRLTQSVTPRARARSQTQTSSMLDSVLEALNLKTRPKDDRMGNLHLNLMGSIQRIFNLENLESSVLELLKTGGDMLKKGSLPVSLLKFRNLGEVNLRVPTLNGMSVTYSAELPILVSVQGDIQQIPGGISANLASVLDWKLTAELRTDLHFSDDYVAGGVITRVVCHGPHHWSISKKLNTLTLSWTPNEHTTDILRYDVTPYTAARSSRDVTPLWESLVAPFVSRNQPKFRQLVTLKNNLGVDIQYEVHSELEHNDGASWIDWWSKWDANSYSNLGFVPLDLTKRAYALRYNADGTTATQLDITFFHQVFRKTDSATAVYNLDQSDPTTVVPDVVDPSTVPEEVKMADKLNGMQSGGHARILSSHIVAKQKSGDVVRISAVLGLAYNDDWNVDLTEAHLDSIVEKASGQREMQFRGYLFSKRTWNNPPVFDLSEVELLHTEDTRIYFSTQGFMKPDSEIHFQALLKRDQRAAEIVRSGGAASECLRQKSQGIIDSPACSAARYLDGIYNIYSLNATYSNVSRSVSDVMWRIGRSINHALYPYITKHEMESNPAGTLSLLAERNPQNGDVDIDIRRPWETIQARKVRDFKIAFSPLTTAYSGIFFPLNARCNFLCEARALTYAEVDKQQCYVRSQSITTLDQVEYDYSLGNCDHVLLTSTSEQSKRWAVLGRHEGSSSVVTILYGAVVIELSTADGSVTINGQVYDPAKTARVELHKAGRKRVASVVSRGKIIEFTGPDFELRTTGTQVTIQPNLKLRGRVAGLCGDFDLEVTGEFKTPQRCALTSGALMAQTYRLKSPAGCSAASDLSNQLVAETSTCNSVDQIIRSALPVDMS